MNYDLIPQGLRSKFFGILYCDNKIFYIPCRSKYLAVLHLSTSEITYHKIVNSDKHEQKSKNGMFVKNAYFIKDNWLYLGMLYEDLVIRIHTNSFEVESVWTGDGKTGFADMFLDDNQVEAWLLSNIDNRIIKWNTLDNHMESYHFCNMQDIERYDYPYLNMSRLGEDIYIYSYEAGNSYKFNKTSKKAVIIDENSKVFGKDESSQIIHLFSKRINDSLLINNAYDLSFDLYTNGEITRHITLYDNNYTNRLDLRRGLKRKNEDFISNVTINETKEFALKDFIGAVEGISEKSVNDRNEVYVCRI